MAPPSVIPGSALHLPQQSHTIFTSTVLRPTGSSPLTQQQVLILDDLMEHPEELEAFNHSVQEAFRLPTLYSGLEVVSADLAAKLGAPTKKERTVDGSVSITPNEPMMAMAGGAKTSAWVDAVKSWIRQNEPAKKFFNSLPKAVKKELSELFAEVKPGSTAREIFAASLALFLARRLIGFERIIEKLDAGNLNRIAEHQIYLEETRELGENLIQLLEAGVLYVPEVFPKNPDNGFVDFMERLEDVEVRVVDATEALAEAGDKAAQMTVSNPERESVHLASLRPDIDYVFYPGLGLCRYLGRKTVKIGDHSVEMVQLKKLEDRTTHSISLADAKKLLTATAEELDKIRRSREG